MTNFIPALVGYLIMSVGAYLGGALVFVWAPLMSRSTCQADSGNLPVVGFEELPENRPQRTTLKEEPVLAGAARAAHICVGAVCSHYGAPSNKEPTRFPSSSVPDCALSLEDGLSGRDRQPLPSLV